MKKEHWVLKLPKQKPNYLLTFQWKRLKDSGTSGLKYICHVPQYENFKGTFELFLDENDIQYLIKTKHLKKEFSWGVCQKVPPLTLTPKRVNKCKKCGRVIKDDEKIFNGMCKSCFTDMCSNREGYFTEHVGGINGLRVGIEIEIDDKSINYGNPQNWGDIPKIHGWKRKSDGSLTYGREYVSPICTPSQLKADLKEFAKGLPPGISKGRAGIHIHVNKAGFLSKIDVKKLIKIFYGAPESQIKYVFGRGYSMYNSSISSPWEGTQHGAIINTDGVTVEFRGFTAKHTREWYLYCVDTVISMCEYVRHTGYNAVSWDGWKEWNIKYGRK